ncbi:serine/threonine protein kinase [Phormidium sp. LEGE 05292]|uniref:serine/threonine-protein kinase n=1 Tax=[Phormidium] sp. LEGE 05292 TaxID=767427 RepID=UPI00187FE837|nr:serine/threonine-protein kinase [Phormidium sp. LEGE 05292]MBE9224640.1 serine/threonine protein kinase [Phormidium sp. LEGE 05292]
MSTKKPYLGNGSHYFQSLLNQRLNHRYRIINHLGQGGFGYTFLAVDEQQNLQPCVIKQVFFQSNTTHHQTTTERFHQEVKKLAQLGEHPQIPELFNTFEQDGCGFIVQEWIDGLTLEQEAKAIPFNEVEVWQFLREILPVIQHLHDRQIIHRDIKPANIIRRQSDRQLILVDFGAAKQITHLNSCHTGTMIGSVEYAAPEQIKGQAVFASDLYSLGVTCLYLLTQMRPFDLYDIVEDDWKWQAYLPQPISSELKAILYKLLQPAVRRRYQLVSEILADLNSSTEKQTDSAIQSRNFSDSTLLKSITNFVQKTPSVSGATVYLPLTQNWYYLPGRENAWDCETEKAFFLSLRSTSAANTPPVRETLPFAQKIIVLKAFPLVRQALIVSINALIGGVAMAFLVYCLGNILFFISTPPYPNATPLKDERSTLKLY